MMVRCYQKFIPVFLVIVFLGILTVRHASAAAPTFVICCIDLTAPSSTEIDLIWRVAPADYGVTGYKIERESPIGGGFTTIVANTSSTAVTYTDTNLSPGVTYSYRVSSLNGDGVGPASTVLAAIATPIPVVPVPPAQAQNLTVTAVSGSEIDLAWSAPTDNGGSPITGYKIEREFPVGGGFTTVVANTNSVATTYADTNLSPGMTYNYRIRAINAYGLSYYPSAAADAVVPAKPGAPQNATAIAGDGRATISWFAPLFTVGGITSYVVSSTPTSSMSVVGSSTFSATITSLTNGVSYLFSVSAVNKAGQGLAATTNTIIPKANLPPQTQSSSLPVAVIEPPATQSLQDQINTLMATLQALNRQAQNKGIILPPDKKQLVAAPDKFSRSLNLGSTGNDVKALQTFLINQNKGPLAQKLAGVGASGYFGLLTKSALAEYQKSVGIDPSIGNFGPKTRGYVNSLSGQ